MFKKITAVAAAALFAVSVVAMSASGADARGRYHHGGGGAAVVGGIALGILATEAIRSSSRECHRECRWVPGDCWINDRGREVCRRGHRECERYCD
jgi:hypothetical protein